jgi:CRISPR system Cascade subunit CasE
MMSDSDSFYMTELWLDPKALAGLADRKGLLRQRPPVTTNYMVHCALGELFQDAAPKPFAVQDAPRQLDEKNLNQPENGRAIRVLGYTGEDWDALHTRAKMSASPTAYETCVPDRCAAKPMPDTFPEGMILQFDLRACPVVRKASAGEGTNQQGETRTWEAGDELDAYLAEAWTWPEDEDLSREQVYREWLARQFDIRGGAEVDRDSIAMTRFSIERMTRRTGPDRTADTIKRPDVTLTGRLQVTDGDAFVDLLRSGLGRHKSFGYGMLKVRRAR